MHTTTRIALTTTAVTALVAASSALITAPTAQAAPTTPVTATISANSPIVTAWEQAWSGTDPAQLGRLFTPGAVYVDHAIGVTMNGRDQVTGWKQRTDQFIDGVTVTVHRSFRSGNHVTIESTYAGHIKGAPTPFAVPICTVLDLSHGKIAKNQDYYSLASVLSQSGLPADWTPGQ